ncbi:MAG: hypothetical protein K5Q00_06770, partial [Gammaproteobacteria bacterium]|nr:hypothetical protein [Gammaproteobacteria bacterium]
MKRDYLKKKSRDFFNFCLHQVGVCAVLLMSITSFQNASAQVVEFNNTGATNTTNGLRITINNSTQMQVRRWNTSTSSTGGQVYSPNVVPNGVLSNDGGLDNGIFLRANGRVYGPSHGVGSGYAPSGGMYSTSTIGAVTPTNPSSPGVQQSATSNLGITNGPQMSIVWKYTTPLDFMTAEVSLTIPNGYAVSASNPVRYQHVYDTFLGGNDSGCGVRFVDANGKQVVGTYPPPSGTSCTSSTSIPAGVSIVESFRERNGNFSRYCASGWGSFYFANNTNCYLELLAGFNNTIVTSYQDTGIGIAYDFTAPGTYTFSYDFVIGSTTVPSYDHIEISSDGSATLCPETLTVKACTSSTVPCPLADVVSTGVLQGAVTLTPVAPGVTLTPSNFSIGGSSSTSGSTASLILQATAASANTYILGSTITSGTIPLNGTKCVVNGVASSCSFTITNTPCVSKFDCVETSVATVNTTRNPLYTKLAGTAFSFDVVALNA